MTTALAAWSALMIRVLAMTFAAVLILLILTIAASAQDAIAVTPTGPAPVDDSWAASIALIRDSLIATILTIITGVVAWGAKFAPAWMRAIIDKLTTSEAIEWDDHVKIALGNAFDVAATKVGLTPENLATMEQKADFMGWAVGTLRKYNREIVTFADKDQNGVIDLVEDELARRGANPKLFQVPTEPFPVDPPDTQQSFASMPPRRAVSKAKGAADLASTFAPRKRGTVVQ